MNEEKLLSKRDLLVGLVVGGGFVSHFTGLVDWPWFIDWTVGLWFYTVWGFFALIHAQAVVQRADGSWWVTWMSPLLVLFWPADAAFNATYGSIIFREAPLWPKEFMFSSRVKRHYKNLLGDSTLKQKNAANRWHIRLRAVDPIGHDFDK